jgi:cytochrome c551/c552
MFSSLVLFTNNKNVFIIICFIIFCLIPIKYGSSAETGEEIFQGNCAGCHTIGKGNLVGPDLSGVTLRREESWLIRQIKDPDGLVEEKDPTALELLKEFNMPMVALGLSDNEITEIILYLKNVDKNINQDVTSTSDLSSRYIFTIIISILMIIFLTLLALKVGKKNVDIK